MTIHQEHCNPQEWLNARQELARALASGRYTQQPKGNNSNPPLRDAQDRYTVTGVAADQCPIVWVRLQSKWHAVWMDVLSAILPGRRSFKGDLTGLSEAQQQRLLDNSAGETASLPEIAAHQLGLHAGHGHETRLTVHPNAFPEGVRARLGLPKRHSPYPADDLSFNQAAQLIAQHPLALGSCDCE